jgi:hypothetical protein
VDKFRQASLTISDGIENNSINSILYYCVYMYHNGSSDAVATVVAGLTNQFPVMLPAVKIVLFEDVPRRQWTPTVMAAKRNTNWQITTDFAGCCY